VRVIVSVCEKRGERVYSRERLKTTLIKAGFQSEEDESKERKSVHSPSLFVPEK